MALRDDISVILDKMILSASGWRGIFDISGDEESAKESISEAHSFICAAASFVFAEYLKKNCEKPIVLLGSDTRPTGKQIIKSMMPILLSCGCEVHYAGFTASPEIMAWARGKNKASGFIYISASHNPIGYNGIKFGLADGGVLAAEEMEKLISDFRTFIKKDDYIEKIKSMTNTVDSAQIEKVFAGELTEKADALKAYYDFCEDVVWAGDVSVSSALRSSLLKNPIGIVCDFNGSARTVSIDKSFFRSLGLKFKYINANPGEIVHRIVPEGESLEPCRLLLEKAHSNDSSFMLGYVPDCDGDRGNLVIWSDEQGKARIEACASNACAQGARALEAQEVFALACVAELSQLVFSGELDYDENGNQLSKAAIAINDPTSMRIDRIAEAFGVSVFRAEVGEANVVNLARKKRSEGYIVRILGEGSAGGNITHPSAVRDPLHTVLAIVKLLAVRSTAEKPGLYEIWCKRIGYTYREDFTLDDIIESLPKFVTTGVYSEKAVLRIKTKDPALLKDRYQKIFLKQWKTRQDELKTKHNIYSWEAIAYNGLEEKRNIKDFAKSGKGGLKILFFDKECKETAYIWLRASATEPVLRIMADAQAAANAKTEGYLLHWQQNMIIEADRF